MIRHTPAELRAQRDECARIKSFLRRKGSSAGCSLRDATTYAEAAALIDAYLEALEAVHGETGYGRTAVVHGQTCVKQQHALGGAYLHSAVDDSPYDVDGCRYCGRCHQAL
jgi:hypothetical protein